MKYNVLNTLKIGQALETLSRVYIAKAYNKGVLVTSNLPVELPAFIWVKFDYDYTTEPKFYNILYLSDITLSNIISLIERQRKHISGNKKLLCLPGFEMEEGL